MDRTNNSQSPAKSFANYIPIKDHDRVVSGLKIEIEKLREEYHNMLCEKVTGDSVVHDSIHYDEMVLSLKNKIEKLSVKIVEHVAALEMLRRDYEGSREENKRLREKKIVYIEEIEELKKLLESEIQEKVRIQLELEHAVKPELCLHGMHENLVKESLHATTLLGVLDSINRECGVWGNRLGEYLKSIENVKGTINDSLVAEVYEADKVRHDRDSLVQRNLELKQENLDLRDQSESRKLKQEEKIEKLSKNVNMLEFTIRERDSEIETIRKMSMMTKEEKKKVSGTVLFSQYDLSSLPDEDVDMELMDSELESSKNLVEKLKGEIYQLNSNLLNKATEMKRLIRENSAIDKRNTHLQDAFDKSKAEIEMLNNKIIGLEIQLSDKEDNKKKRKREVAFADDVDLPTPQKKSREAPPLIMLTGFGNGNPEFSLEKKRDLIQQIKKLGGVVSESEKFGPEITHVVYPPSVKTVKCYAALATARWSVTLDWIEESSKHGDFLSCDAFGQFGSFRPYQGKKFYISEALSSVVQTPIQQIPLKHLISLVSTIGKGQIVKGISQSDYILTTDDDRNDYLLPTTVLPLKEFLENVGRELFWK